MAHAVAHPRRRRYARKRRRAPLPRPQLDLAIHGRRRPRLDLRNLGHIPRLAAPRRQVRRGDRATQVVLWKQTRPADDDDNPTTTTNRAAGLACSPAPTPCSPPSRSTVPPTSSPAASSPPATRPTASTPPSTTSPLSAPTSSTAGNRAYYQPATDEIHVPDLDRFDQAPHYYATLAHPIPARRPRPSSNGKSRCPCDVLSAGIITRCRWAEVAQLCLPRRRCYERGCVAPWAPPAGRSNRAVTPTRCATVLTRVCLPALARRALTCGVAQPGGVNSGATTMFCSEVIDQRSAFGPAYSGSS